MHKMLATGLLMAVALNASAYDENEPTRFAKTNERADEYNQPEFRALMTQITAEEDIRLATIKATDPERDSNGSLCQQHRDGCLGDPRFYHWGDEAGRIRQEVVFTSRNGATISGHVWATEDGPAQRPAILINSGSVQAPEELWGWAGAVLAQHGYVVMTWDPQGQGYSDTRGACSNDFPDLDLTCPDRTDGVPAQSNPTQPFYLGSQDALDFFLSTPDNLYQPRDSRNGLNHAGKQDRRVAEGFNDAFNPLWERIDPQRVGVAGNSLGASSAAQLAMFDERIDAIVGWDNLRGADENSQFGGVPLEPRVPGLGISNDYGLDVVPHTQKPDPESRNGGFDSFVEHGVDVAQINIRGGTHFESAYIPNPKFGATLYGMDLTAWYTLAWMDKYVKRDSAEAIADADRRLTTDRWLCDPRSAAIEERLGHAMNGVGDANMISIDLTSKFAITLDDASAFDCADMRSGCEGQLAPDGLPGPYSYLDDAFGIPPDSSMPFAACNVLGLVQRLTAENLEIGSGDTATATFAIVNNSGDDHSVNGLTLELDGAEHFDQATIRIDGEITATTTSATVMNIVFDPALSVPANTNLDISVELGPAPVTALMINSAHAGGEKVEPYAVQTLGFLFVLGLLAVFMRRNLFAGALMATILTLAACNGSSPGQATGADAELRLMQINAEDAAGDPVNYDGLPLVLARIVIR